MNLIAARAYAQVVRFSKHRFAYAPRGLGRLLRSYRQPHVLSVEGCSVFFYPPIALAYNHAIYGSWPEQETHRFLKDLINKLPESTTFVNVGANIGEFVLDLSVNCPRLTSILAIEPHPDCALVLKVNVALNGLTNVRIEEVVLGESSREVFFHLAEARQLSSSSAESLDLEGRRYKSIRYQMTTLDALDIASSTNLVLLIDVEGSELDVLKGASKTIKERRPLIVFEYNHVSKQHFDIREVAEYLGENNEMYRINEESALDKNFEQAWNCVGVPKDGVFNPVYERTVAMRPS